VLGIGAGVEQQLQQLQLALRGRAVDDHARAWRCAGGVDVGAALPEQLRRLGALLIAAI
jgi:hypothetical protein